jgi:hypothetical protein
MYRSRVLTGVCPFNCGQMTWACAGSAARASLSAAVSRVELPKKLGFQAIALASFSRSQIIAAPTVVVTPLFGPALRSDVGGPRKPPLFDGHGNSWDVSFLGVRLDCSRRAFGSAHWPLRDSGMAARWSDSTPGMGGEGPARSVPRAWGFGSFRLPPPGRAATPTPGLNVADNSLAAGLYSDMTDGDSLRTAISQPLQGQQALLES